MSGIGKRMGKGHGTVGQRLPEGICIIHYSRISYYCCHKPGKRVVLFYTGKQRFFTAALFSGPFQLLSLFIIQPPPFSIPVF